MQQPRCGACSFYYGVVRLSLQIYPAAVGGRGNKGAVHPLQRLLGAEQCSLAIASCCVMHGQQQQRLRSGEKAAGARGIGKHSILLSCIKVLGAMRVSEIGFSFRFG